MKTSELTGAALDWAVAQATGFDNGDWLPNYSTEWCHGGAIIESERIELQYMDNFESWAASMVHEFGQESFAGYGKNPLVAAMRCYVASKLGDEVEIPELLAI